MNRNKICFITSVNNNKQYQESLKTWHNLLVPEEMQIEAMTITGASSMVEAYQKGMELSDAKYKIYIHQDVWIKDRYFLYTVVEKFRSDATLGMLGVVGSRYLPCSLAWWEAEEKLGAVSDNHLGKMESYVYECSNKSCQNAAALDGLILITQYDLPWRTDLFDDWHFYDTSQCMEFHRAGLKIAVLPVSGGETAIWHWCGQKLLTSAYHEAQKKFIKEYGTEVIDKWLKL